MQTEKEKRYQTVFEKCFSDIVGKEVSKADIKAEQKRQEVWVRDRAKRTQEDREMGLIFGPDFW